MPTYDRTASFIRDYEALDPEQRAAFRRAVVRFIEDLPTGRFRKGLRVKGIKGAPGLFEMTWADNGRATFEYGDQLSEGEPHIIWRRIGTHDVFDAP